MLVTLVVISSIFLLVIAPVMTVLRYYQPAQFSILNNFFLIVLTVITWPFVPIVVATRKHDVYLLSMFWVSLLVWLVAIGYWIAVNVDQFIELQEQFLPR